MKKQILLFSLILLGVQSHSQTDYRVIGAAHYINASISSDFYIDQIVDQRDFQANLGIVNRGTNKVIKRALIPEEGFLDIMKDRINEWMPADVSAHPVSMHLRQLYLWEHLNNQNGTGFIRLEVGFKEKEDELATVIAVELSGQKTQVTGGHALRLEQAFFDCLNRYKEQRQNDSVIHKANINNTDNPSSKMMGALNFLDLKKENFQRIARNIILKRSDRRRLLRYRAKSVEEMLPYYAFKKGEHLYIKANNFPGAGNYYLRVLEQGRYLFMIDEVFIDPKSGFKPKLPHAQVRVGIILDMETGIPKIVTDELMADLLKDYPVLQEHYIFKDILKNPFQLTRVQKAIAEINRKVNISQ